MDALLSRICDQNERVIELLTDLNTTISRGLPVAVNNHISTPSGWVTEFQAARPETFIPSIWVDLAIASWREHSPGESADPPAHLGVTEDGTFALLRGDLMLTTKNHMVGEPNLANTAQMIFGFAVSSDVGHIVVSTVALGMALKDALKQLSLKHLDSTGQHIAVSSVELGERALVEWSLRYALDPGRGLGFGVDPGDSELHRQLCLQLVDPDKHGLPESLYTLRKRRGSVSLSRKQAAALACYSRFGAALRRSENLPLVRRL